MGAPIILIGGQKVSIPGVYPEVDASALAPLLSASARIPLVIGKSDGGDPGKIYVFRNMTDAVAIIRNGDVLSYIGRIFNPGPGMPGASVVAFIRSDASASVSVRDLAAPTWDAPLVMYSTPDPNLFHEVAVAKGSTFAWTITDHMTEETEDAIWFAGSEFKHSFTDGGSAPLRIVPGTVGTFTLSCLVDGASLLSQSVSVLAPIASWDAPALIAADALPSYITVVGGSSFAWSVTGDVNGYVGIDTTLDAPVCPILTNVGDPFTFTLHCLVDGVFPLSKTITVDPARTRETDLWNSIAMSFGGSMVFATSGAPGGSLGDLYVSSNGGISFGKSAIGQLPWVAVACSDDGQYVIAGTGNVPNGSPYPMYRSDDFGGTFTETGIETNYWQCVAMSSDGSVVYAGAYNNQKLYKSVDYGETWTELAASASASWYSLSCSGDGVDVFAIGSGSMYVSHNSGLTWDWVANGPKGAAFSSDGQYALLVGDGFYWVSSDGGANWDQHTTATNLRNACVSSDGTRMAMTDTSGKISVSDDSGATWSDCQPETAVFAICLAKNGASLAAGSTSGAMYLSSNLGGRWY